MTTQLLTVREEPRAATAWHDTAPVDVAVIIPEFNERDGIEPTIKRVPRVMAVSGRVSKFFTTSTCGIRLRRGDGVPRRDRRLGSGLLADMIAKVQLSRPGVS